MNLSDATLSSNQRPHVVRVTAASQCFQNTRLVNSGVRGGGAVGASAPPKVLIC